jgi:hypothetical protein
VLITYRRGGVSVRPGGGRAHGWRLCIEPGAARLEVGAGSRMWLDAGSFPLPWSTPRPRRPEVVVELRRPKVQAEPAGSPVSRATSRPAAPAHGSLSPCAGAGNEGARKGSGRPTYLGSASTRETARETRAMAKWGNAAKKPVAGKFATDWETPRKTHVGECCMCTPLALLRREARARNLPFEARSRIPNGSGVFPVSSRRYP